MRMIFPSGRQVAKEYEKTTGWPCPYPPRRSYEVDKEACQDGSKIMWHSYTKDFYCKYREAKDETTE